MSDCRPVRLVDARPAMGFRPLWGALAIDPPRDEPINSGQSLETDFAAGYSQGRAEAEQSFADERAGLMALVAGCGALQPEPSEELALLIAETVERLVRATAGEMAIDLGLLAKRAHRAAALIAATNGARTLHLNPADLALLDPATLPLEARADPAVERGSLRIEDSTGWVEDGVALHLDLLREQLGLAERAL